MPIEDLIEQVSSGSHVDLLDKLLSYLIRTLLIVMLYLYKRLVLHITKKTNSSPLEKQKIDNKLPIEKVSDTMDESDEDNSWLDYIED